MENFSRSVQRHRLNHQALCLHAGTGQVSVQKPEVARRVSFMELCLRRRSAMSSTRSSARRMEAKSGHQVSASAGVLHHQHALCAPGAGARGQSLAGSVGGLAGADQHLLEAFLITSLLSVCARATDRNTVSACWFPRGAPARAEGARRHVLPIRRRARVAMGVRFRIMIRRPVERSDKVRRQRIVDLRQAVQAHMSGESEVSSRLVAGGASWYRPAAVADRDQHNTRLSP